MGEAQYRRCIGAGPEGRSEVGLAHPVARSRIDARTRARLLGCFVAAVGLIDVGSALTPAVDHRFELISGYVTPSVRETAAGATALVGLALLLIGRGLVHRRKLAYRMALVLLAVSTVTHIVKGLDIEEAIIAAIAAVTLVRWRQLFTVPVAPARLHSIARTVPVVVGLVFAYGLAGLLLRRSTIRQSLTVANAIQDVAARLVGLSGGLQMHGRFGQWFPASITVVGIAGVLLLLFIVLAPVAERAVADPLARDRVRNLMNRPDGDTLDAFALRHDKHYVFSADGRAAVAYRYVRGVGLMSGDPVGDPASFADAFRMFHDLCEGQGWRVAVLGARRDRLDVYETGRMRELYLGDEAIIDTATFTLDGRHMRPVRQATNRTINHGITCEVYREGAPRPDAAPGADRHRRPAPGRPGGARLLDGARRSARRSPPGRARDHRAGPDAARRSRFSATSRARPATPSRSTRCDATTSASTVSTNG